MTPLVITTFSDFKKLLEDNIQETESFINKKMKQLLFFLLFLGVISCDSTTKLKLNTGEILITWHDSIAGDFSFKDNWSYPEGVYKNEFGQLSCDGLCPEEIDRMQDENGRIYDDSLKAFYQLVDTTHEFHSIQSEARTYEWAGTDFITVERVSKDTVICYTQNNTATHSSLDLIIVKDIVKPTIILNSITPTGTKIHICKSGQIKIDRNLWDKGIMKAEFDFIFDDKENPSEPMYWKGKIYTRQNLNKEARRHNIVAVIIERP